MRCKISRRDFMKGAAVVAASGLLVGCGGEASAPSAGDVDKRQVLSTPSCPKKAS